jgi:serine O-acetyltransferase
MIGAGAKVLGPFTVGDNARIAANAVVLKEVPPDATAVGVPARIVRVAGRRANYVESIDHISVTDPLDVELSAITAQMQVLERQLVSHDPAIYKRLDEQDGEPGQDESGDGKC